MMDDKWQTIETAPDFERIWICGWTNPTLHVEGYWWWHEGMAINGMAIYQSTALYWCPIVLPPFPAPPELKGE